MKNRWINVVLAAIIGELALILLTTFAQEVLFNGISYSSSSLFDLTFGGIATVMAAVLAGMIMRVVCKRGSLIPFMVVSLIVVIEMTYLITAGLTGDPLWFDILAGASLILGLAVGYFGLKKLLLAQVNHATNNPSRSEHI